MRATFKTNNGTDGKLDYPVIMPQPMQHTDGFTLLAFESWEGANDEKISAAVTNVSEFHIVKDEIGFASVKEQN